jgi:hypothetical protein
MQTLIGYSQQLAEVKLREYLHGVTVLELNSLEGLLCNRFVVGYEQRVSAVVCHISGKLPVGPTAFEIVIPRIL